LVFRAARSAAHRGGLYVSDGLADISGGIISELDIEEWADVYVSGGTIERGTSTSDQSILVIDGGTFGSPIIAFGTSYIYIEGSGFNYPYGPIPVSSGTLTGTLSDGTPLDVEFGRASTAVIELPEPSALMALESGIAMLALLYRRHRYSVKR
jgi:hypothetical protein